MSSNNQKCSNCKKEKEKFEKGYKDGRNEKPCRPSSKAYLEGYREGKEIKRIAMENEARAASLSRNIKSSII